MTGYENQLLDLLKLRSVRRGSFQLASGEISDYYIDAKMITTCSVGAYLVGEVLYDRTKNLEIDAIGGVQVGAVPLISAAVMSYYHHRKPMEGFWVRDNVKPHGTQKLIEGGIRDGLRVAIVDDVVNKGGSVLKAVEAVRELNCEVAIVLSLVDRLQGAEELLLRNGIENYQTVLTCHDLGIRDVQNGLLQFPWIESEIDDPEDAYSLLCAMTNKCVVKAYQRRDPKWVKVGEILTRAQREMAEAMREMGSVPCKPV